MRSNTKDPSIGAGALFSGLTFDREALTRLLRECGDGPTFEHCNFGGEDFSNLDLRAARFTQCNFEHTLLEHCELAGSRWLACK
ncbi:pentapeptide repeat-containing protein [Paraburkholderia sp. CNPSo 3274]|uniref:pentapeptide repeat-containing protein n=1 Tax=Paraburkholderia sp. CNPSo 3274 TaxID=2940932 RepID=UPI0020B76187|nr:pentapeptide repeat-containing protein [Paraburkholderia sp. CNPSo 3274]MCP3707295.1 pentapeptide repeat-containing protein [Paraburkholderia sp. CNPSo 3274]